MMVVYKVKPKGEDTVLYVILKSHTTFFPIGIISKIQGICWCEWIFSFG